MTFAYSSHGATIHPHRHVVDIEGKSVRVRPKTFALLLVLLERPREVLGKRFLLDTVWDDVAVDEQVLVQSIREIRQLFGSPDVIETYPRKGYAWAADVQEQPLVEAPVVAQVLAPIEAPVVALQPLKSRWPFYLIPLILLLAVCSAFYLATRASTPPIEGPVMVLPIKTNLPGNDHKWVSLGAMDQLIDLLASSSQDVVMDTEYVLNAMQYAGMPRDYTSEQVSRIFSVSGGALVVESELSGSVGEYRLDYRLHFKNDVKRGVVFGQSIDDVLRDLGFAIAPHSDQSGQFPSTDRRSEFSNELMSRALEYRDQGELELAQGLLTSLKQLEPQNLVARRLLAQLLLDLNSPALAEAEIRAAIALSPGSEESARLHYWLSAAEVDQGLLEQALATLQQTKRLAAEQNDWLYQAYTKQLQGQTLQRLGRYPDAQAAFAEALKYHGIIRCPIGEAQTRLQLANLFSIQGNQSLADAYFVQAKNQIEAHRLEFLKPLISDH